MAMTITATMSGATANEHIYLQVDVLTGATEAGGASLNSIGASGGASAGGSLTPNASNSLIAFAISADNPGTNAFTALTNNSLTSTGLDGDDWLYGHGHFTGTVTAGTPVAFGGSCTSSDYTTWAGYEVHSSGTSTPALDASAPALASATGAGVKTVTSASFNPPAGSVLVAKIVAGGSGTSGSLAMAVSGGSLTWTQRAGNPTVTDQSTYVFTATVPAAAGPVAARPPAYAPGWHPGTAPGTRFGGTPFYVPANGTTLSVTPLPVALAEAGAGADGLTFLPIVPLADAGAGADALALGTITISLTDSGTGHDGFGPPQITGLGGTGAGYFVDTNGQPKMVLGDAVWGLPGNAGRWNSGNWQADYDGYFAHRGTQGFSVAYTKPMGTTQNGGINDDGRTFDGLVPFQGGSLANPSTGLTAAFWARIDYMFASAAAQGITIFFNAIGYNSDFQTSGPLTGKSATEFGAYGTALGNRYKNTPNLIWMVADDYFGGSDTEISAFLTAVRATGDVHPITIENYPETTSREDLPGGTAPAWGLANAQFNFCYSYNVTYYGIEKAYLESSPITVIQGDGYFYQGNSSYEGGSGAFAFDRAIRQDAWHVVSSGGRGIIHGDEACWQWQSNALADSATGWYYANNAGHIRTLMESLPNWQLLVPDTSSVLVTSGRGTHASGFSSGGGGGQYEVAFTDSYVTASRVSDGSLAVIYLSHATTIGIDQTKMVSGYTAWWVDPVSGAKTSTTAGSSYNSGTPGNNSQGDPDWVLVLQAPASTSVPLTDSGTGSDALAVTAAVALTDAGSGADALAVPTRTDALADSGSGADALAVAIPVALADSGAGSDALAVPSETQALADAGSGADALTVSIPVALADAGAGADALAVAIPVPLTDAGAGADALTVLAVTAVALTDAGAGADALTVLIATAVALTDAGAGADALAPGNPQVALADAGAGADALTVSQPAALADAGSGADALAVSIPAALADAGAGADALLLTTPVALSEAGAGADALAVSQPTALTDAGSGADALGANGNLSVPLTDAGTGADALASSAAVPLADAGAGADGLALALPVALTDAGAGADALTQTSVQPVALTDAGAGTDALVLAAITIPLADAGAGSDALALASLTAALADSGTGTDGLLITRAVALSDLGAAADTFNLALLKALTDTGTGTEVLRQSLPPLIVPATSTAVVFAANPSIASPASSDNSSSSSVRNLRSGSPSVS